MSTPIVSPQDQVFWYLKRSKEQQQLTKSIKTDVVVIGGGVAGLSAAQSFRAKGYAVVLLEKYYCGSGASGKSSGFVTPDSELGLRYFCEKFGTDEARKLWGFVTHGVESIRKNIIDFSLDCDYLVEDSLVVANSSNDFLDIEQEHKAREQLSYKSSLYTQETVPTILGSHEYFGGVRYPNTFGMNAYAYCQGMKEQLTHQGVAVYEETPALEINAKGVTTPHGTVAADAIIVCVDRFLPDLQENLYPDVFPVQTFLMISAPLPEHDVKKIFPEKKLMVWDTDFIYQYFRMTGDDRFMVGGSNMLSILWGEEQHNNTRMIEKLQTYVATKFPDVSITFEYSWPGLIGISKDIMPLAGYDEHQKNIYYISCATGLPWAAALGSYSADKIVDKRNDLDKYFALDRTFPIGGGVQTVLGKRISFALSNLWTMWQ